MLASIQAARQHAAAVRDALRNLPPERVLECMPLLEEAIRSMRAFEGDFKNIGGHERVASESTVRSMHAELLLMKQDLDVAAMLAERAFAAYQGLARMLGAAATGYTATGSPPALASSHSVSLSG